MNDASKKHVPNTNRRPFKAKTSGSSSLDNDKDQWLFPKNRFRSSSKVGNMHQERRVHQRNPNFTDLQKVSTSIFITNFPHDASTSEIWKHCEEWGKVADVYISPRLTKSGRKFGFGSTIITSQKKRVSIPVDECLDAKATDFFMGKVVDPLCIPNLRSLFVKEGFSEVRFRYIGGRWVGMAFNNVESALKFDSCVALKNIFTSLKLLSNSFIPDERCIWVDFIGLPVVATTPAVVKRIVELDGHLFEIRAKEFANWAPSYRFYESSSSDDSEEEDTYEEGEINESENGDTYVHPNCGPADNVNKDFQNVEVKSSDVISPMPSNIQNTAANSGKIDNFRGTVTWMMYRKLLKLKIRLPPARPNPQALRSICNIWLKFLMVKSLLMN
ncbi:hypothetical protein SSX86_008606 [Deinandra increscens subsp. villosa]|uniref:RRM domain-containing protein n=1 Tax=Deinandra increscens subsp. villosa TaxID=3103831 RepID=A0AAP0DJD4_9ASTR